MKKTINIKAKRLIASVLSTVMCLTIVSSNAFAADDVSYDENDDCREHLVTLSVDEFADLTSEYGSSVSIGDGDVAEPQVSKPVYHKFVNENSQKVVQDTPLLYETIQLKDFDISSNIDCLIIEICSGKSINPQFWDIITADGQYTTPKKVTAGTQYRIFMTVIPKKGEEITEKNYAEIEFYWTDKDAELIKGEEDEVM